MGCGGSRDAKGEKKAPGEGVNCWDASPDIYKVVVDNEFGKLVQMKMAPGQADVAHDHPVHHMYVVSGGDLKITHDGKSDQKTLPTGAAMLGFPAGAHQVENVGDTEVVVIFLEPTGTTGQTPDNHVTPFETNPEQYTILGENKDWVIGSMEMKAGEEDKPHSHRDHFVYCVSGEELTIYPGREKDESNKMVVPIQAGAAMPIPQGAHIVKNTGSTPAKLIFWELNK